MNMFQTYLQEKKELILSSLNDFLKREKQRAVNRWGKDALERLELFMQNGKMIRGALVFLGFELTGDHPTSDVLLTAQAMEFFQAGLLIHDDIMDRDELRRGKPSMHTQYTRLIEQENGRDPIHTGQSLGVCAGDAAFFLGYRLLNQTQNQKVIDLFSQELTTVSFAQMQDAYSGSSLKDVKLEEILTLYRHKTGRYSLVLPMVAGALLAGAKDDTIGHIQKFGDNLGIAFQLVDDTLNLFGDPKITGKPAGSDIRENKKTPYLYFLHQSDEATAGNEVKELIVSYSNSAKEALQKIPMTKAQKEVLLSFVDYLIHRVK